MPPQPTTLCTVPPQGHRSPPGHSMAEKTKTEICALYTRPCLQRGVREEVAALTPWPRLLKPLSPSPSPASYRCAQTHTHTHVWEVGSPGAWGDKGRQRRRRPSPQNHVSTEPRKVRYQPGGGGEHRGAKCTPDPHPGAATLGTTPSTPVPCQQPFAPYS